ncbi:MAG: hypothetical protein EOL88_00695 [Bacteroidia bacterium]|nr:hypothetical protein [Bacteroidia bacterium]
MAKVNLPLTSREEDIFAYILGYIVDNNYSPTRQEIADKFSISPTGAQKFIQSLIDKGRIRVIKKKGGRVWRNIVLVKKDLG